MLVYNGFVCSKHKVYEEKIVRCCSDIQKNVYAKADVTLLQKMNQVI